MDDKQRVLADFQQRIDEVIAQIEPERLLLFNVAEGWEPLCRFLDVSVPDQAFPNIDSHEEFWQTFGGN